MFPVILALRADLIMLVIEKYKLLSEAVYPKFSGSMLIEIFLHLSDSLYLILFNLINNLITQRIESFIQFSHFRLNCYFPRFKQK